MSFGMDDPLNPLRHPELVSGSIKRAQSNITKWTLKQVQGDGVLGSVP
jgi:hypothetical protein